MLTSAAHFLIVENIGEENISCPKIESSSFFIYVGIKSFKTKYFITVRYSTFH